MTFNSWDFIVSFIVFAAVYLRLRSLRWQNTALLIYSWAFYAYGNWRLWFLLFGYSLVAWCIGIFIEQAPTKLSKQIWLWVGITAALITLAIFKYLDFAIDLINDLSGLAARPADLPRLGIILPFGISFYTFQCIAYLVDIFRGEFRAERSFFKFALFKAFFPQLVAGPIERAHNLMPQLSQARKVSSADISEGILLASVGYLLKVVVADTLSPIVNLALDGVDVGPISGATVLLGIGAFGLQIYGDFAGYSFIAVGIARILGIRLTMNFNAPYFAASPSDFWHRWHITLSQWLRDYLYIPLGGSRHGPGRTFAAIMITMILGGLWHGAAWNFIFWGMFHGCLLIADRILRWPQNPTSVATRLLLSFVTFILVHVGWLLFRVHDLHHLMRALHAIIFDLHADQFTSMVASAYFPLLMLIILEHAFTSFRTGHPKDLANESVTVFLAATAAITVVTIGFSATPFIYFQF